MKRYNYVAIMGELVEYFDKVDPRVWIDDRDGIHGYTLVAVLESDRPEYGGRHPLLIPGRQGLEARAMLIAQQALEGEKGFEVVVDGWLWSGRRRSWVVGDRVQRRVSPQVRDVAAAIFSRWLRLLLERGEMSRDELLSLIRRSEEGLLRGVKA